MFERHGVVFAPGGKHWSMERIVGGKSLHYTVPTVRGREVKLPYVKAARKALRLTEEYGVADADF